jgi:hypothetical protein
MAFWDDFLQIFNNTGWGSGKGPSPVKPPSSNFNYGNMPSSVKPKPGSGKVAAPPSNSKGIAAPPNPSQGGGSTWGTKSNGAKGGGGGGDPYAAERAAAAKAAAEAAAREAAAKKAGKDQTAKENANTQAIIDALLGSLGGYAAGRDTQISNAEKGLNDALAGILNSYQSAVDDYKKTGDRNLMDEAGKTAANITNRARERRSLQEQTASQGAGETDQLRAQLQAFNNFDANQLEVTGAFYDTERQINSQLTGAGSQAETNRRNAWNSSQEAKGSAWNDYYKNYSDTWTNIQRTAAQNSNIDSDYSTAFVANFGPAKSDPVQEASKYAGLAYQNESKDEEWYRNFEGKQGARDIKLGSTNNAASTSIKAPKAAEGSTLRRMNV